MSIDRIGKPAPPLSSKQADVDALVKAFKGVLEDISKAQPAATSSETQRAQSDASRPEPAAATAASDPARNGLPEDTVFIPAARIGPVIAQLRKNLGLTQTQLAYLAGTSQSAIARLETGGGAENMTLSTAEKIFSAMNYQVGLTIAPKPAAKS